MKQWSWAQDLFLQSPPSTTHTPDLDGPRLHDQQRPERLPEEAEPVAVDEAAPAAKEQPQLGARSQQAQV